MSDEGFWLEEFPVAITVAGADGTILTMNAHSRKSFEKEGGGALVGKSVFDCHPEPARTRVLELYEGRRASHYTVQKNGQRKIIHQIPWFRDGGFSGFVEISVPIPDELPHFDRQ